MWYETFAVSTSTTLSRKYDEEIGAQVGKFQCPCFPSLQEAEAGIELSCLPCQGRLLCVYWIAGRVLGIKKELGAKELG